MKCIPRKQKRRPQGSVLAIVVIVFLILSLIGVALLTISLGVRQRASRLKNEAMAMIAAEAGYEQGILWMGRQSDILGGLATNAPGSSGSNNFGLSNYDYQVSFHGYIGARPIFRIVSNGYCNTARRVVDVFVMQAISGWDMGMCRIPSGPLSTSPVYFAGGELINMKIHINNLNDAPDARDIYITGSPSPVFLRSVEMGESRYTSGNADKYGGVMNLFQGGISFDQPDIRITDEAGIDSKLARFQSSTNPDYVYTPKATANVPNRMPAVQIEFYVDGAGKGRVVLTDDCTVQGYTRAGATHDYKIVPGSGGTQYEKYNVYAYHYKDNTKPTSSFLIEDTYVTQTFAGKQSEPGGQIYVDGNVVLGGDAYDMVIKGKLTIVATGNIWIADPVTVDGDHDILSNMPLSDNPNVLGLIAKGVIKVIDPGMSYYSSGGTNAYPGPPVPTVDDAVYPGTKTHSYVPVANQVAGSSTLGDRKLPDPMVLEAAVTVGGGGWGAENVRVDANHGGRREFDGIQDSLILRGTIVEAVRGVVGQVGTDGFLKNYYLDMRLLNGVLPGNIWFGGKYIPAPAGWHDYRPNP